MLALNIYDMELERGTFEEQELLSFLSSKAHPNDPYCCCTFLYLNNKRERDIRKT